MPPKLEDLFLSQEHYTNVYSDARSRGIMTEEENLQWMMQQGLWSKEQDEKIKGLEKDIENIQVGIYENRAKNSVVREGKIYLKRAESALKDLNREKGVFISNTCEGIAAQEKQVFVFENSCYANGNKFIFENHDAQTWFYLWAAQILPEETIRELARKDPWRSSWSMKEYNDLFIKHDNRDLNIDQKNILTWSKVYDSIQESMDCPPDAVIDDDAMLNGWLILQRRETEESKKKKTIDQTLNPKIANSQEIMLMARSSEDISDIEDLNSHQAQMIKNQRMNTVKSRGTATDMDFQDRKMEMQVQSNNMFKNKFR
jgi:hypothetical protein